MNRAAVRGSAAVLLALSFAASCNDPVAPAQSVYVTLAPALGAVVGASPRSIHFRFVGPQSGFAAALSGSRIFTSVPAGDTITVAVVAPVGQVLNGAVVRVSVPSRLLAVSADSVRLLQAAASDYSLLSPENYTLKVQALLAQ